MRIILPITAVMMLAGCSALNGGAGMDGQGAMGAGMAADMTPTERQAYVRMAAASDLYEIESSRLALQKARNADTRAFAQMMIDDHTRTTQQLMAAAAAAGLPPMTPQLMTVQAQMMAQLSSASPQEFDRLYWQQQLRAHEMAVALHGNYARSGDTPALRAVAAVAVPIVTRHLNVVRQAQR